MTTFLPAVPLVSVIVPTRDRHDLVGRAVDSVLAQTVDDLEVIVVDDGSVRPVELDADPRVRVMRLDPNRGNGTARNAGITEARGRYLAFCDDDDRWRPNLVEVSLAALGRSRLDPPVAVVSGVAVIRADGSTGRRLPTSSPRGRDHFLDAPGERGHLTKQTLFVERDVLASVGGFDERLRSRVWTDLFLRLNRVCSIQATPEVTYELHRDDRPRVTGDPDLRQRSYHQLLRMHADALARHRPAAADFHRDHARLSWRAGQRGAAVAAVGRAVAASPVTVARELLAPVLGPVRSLVGRLRRRVRRAAPVGGPVASDRGERPRPALSLLAVSPLRWEAGYDDLLVAVRRLVDRGVDVGLTIDADGPARERVLFNRHDLGLTSRVHLGPAGGGRHDVCACPTLTERPWPEVIATLPHVDRVVTTEGSWLAEALPADRRRLVPRRDPERLADALAGEGGGMSGP